MRWSQRFLVVTVAAALLTACSAETPEVAVTQDELVPDEAETFELVEYLFVQHADAVTLEDGLLTLEGVGDDILYFSDRPHRIVGRQSVEWFVEAWDKGEDSFEMTPPNAVLTVRSEEDLLDITVVLSNPVLTDRTLVYAVQVLDGPESGIAGDAALFIDAFVKKLKGLARKGVRKELRVAGNLRDGLRGGDPNRPRDPNLPRDPNRAGDPNLPRDPNLGGGGSGIPGALQDDIQRGGGMSGRGEPRKVNRRSSRQGAEIR